MTKKMTAVVFLVGVLLAGCDLGTKELAQNELREGPKQLVSGVLDLRYAENRDVAFGVLRWIPERVRRPLVLSLNVLILCAVVFMLVRSKTTPLERLALLLVLGGAIGNMADRWLRGYVVDFIHLHGWPIFNMADIYLVAGAGLLVIGSLRREARSLHSG